MFGKSAYIKDTYICKYCGKQFTTTKTGIAVHEKHCKANPNFVPGHKPHVSDETRKKLSEALKKAHAEGRASTWKNRAKCNRSYPERWFEKAIKENFLDKDYVTELNVGKWFLDFAWPKKMRYIEIDGSQHQRYVERQTADKEKDDFCKNNGWSVLRLSWSFIYNNPQKAVEIANSFINDGKVVNIDWVDPKLEKIKKVEENKIKRQKDKNDRINLILSLDIDFSKYGWISKVAEILEISPQKTGKWIRKNMPDFWEKTNHLSA